MKCIRAVSLKREEGIIHVPCGKCIYCLNKKRNDWTFRLSQELKISETAVFLTLTYDNENQPWAGNVASLHRPDLTLFFKRLRQHQKRKSKCQTKIKYYAVGEYGTKLERPHYHAIAFNIHEHSLNQLNSIWGNGLTHIGSANPATIRYITKYVINRQGEFTDKVAPFANISKGLGSSYLEKNSKLHKLNKLLYVRTDQGQKQSLPRYYKDKLWNKIYKDLYNTKLADKLGEKEQKIIKKYGLKKYNQLVEERHTTDEEIVKQKLNNKDKL